MLKREANRAAQVANNEFEVYVDAQTNLQLNFNIVLIEDLLVATINTVILWCVVLAAISRSATKPKGSKISFNNSQISCEPLRMITVTYHVSKIQRIVRIKCRLVAI